MRILAAVPHYFHPHGGGKYGSLRPDSVARINALMASLASLKQFTDSAYFLSLSSDPTCAVEQTHHAEVDIIICTTGDRHLITELPVGAHEFIHRETKAEPRLLGFECQLALREFAGAYDWYCFIEDDMVIRDLSFFAKLAWFTRIAGEDALLQANRYEADARCKMKKLYVDGHLTRQATDLFQNVDDRSEIIGDVLGASVCFRRALNPNAGCYFLNGDQFAYWIRQPHFGDRDTRFLGPLESVGNLGIMRTFRIYKAVAPNMSFLEIQHYGAEIMTAVEQATANMQGGEVNKTPG